MRRNYRLLWLFLFENVGCDWKQTLYQSIVPVLAKLLRDISVVNRAIEFIKVAVAKLGLRRHLGFKSSLHTRMR